MLQKRLELRNRGLQFARAHILHRQAVTSEGVFGFLFHHRLQDFEPGACHAIATIASADVRDRRQADSLRFLVRSDDGDSIEVAWAAERNHHPVAVGILRNTPSSGTARRRTERQAQACARNYLRLTGKL